MSNDAAPQYSHDDTSVTGPLRARMERTPLLTPATEAALFRDIRSLHNAAWAAVLLGRRYHPVADTRADDPEWADLRAEQAAALVAARRLIDGKGVSASAVDRRRFGVKWWVAVEKSQAALDAATDCAVEANLRMCVRTASSFFRSRLPFHDRVQAACMGCLRAVRGFKPEMGWRFSTYATPWIRQAIQRAEANTADTIRVPVHMHETRRVVLRAAARLAAAGEGAVPGVAEVAAAAQRGAKDVRAVARLPRVQSASTPVSSNHDGATGRELTIMDTIADEQAPDPVALLADAQRRAALVEGLRRLPPALAAIMRQRLGTALADDAPEAETLHAIGERLELSRERIRQLEAKGVRALQVIIPALLTPEARRTPSQRRVLARAAEQQQHTSA